MARIQYLPKSKLLIGQLVDIGEMVTLKLSEFNISTVDFKLQKENFDSAFNEFKVSLVQITDKESTKRKSELKRSSNASRTGFFKLLQGDMTSANPERKESAIAMKDFINTYKNMSNMIFADLITYTTSLIDKAGKDPFKSLIEKLGYTDRITELNTINNECIHLNTLRPIVNGVRIRVRKTENTRNDFCVAYDKLVTRLNSLAEIKGDTEYLELFTWWNNMIDNYRRAINVRLGKGQVATGDDPENSMHDPDSGTTDTPGGDRPEIE